MSDRTPLLQPLVPPHSLGALRSLVTSDRLNKLEVRQNRAKTRLRACLERDRAAHRGLRSGSSRKTTLSVLGASHSYKFS